MKKLIALVLALALVLASCAVAFADSYTITITNGKDGETYKAYKIFDVTLATVTGSGEQTNVYSNFTYTISASSSYFNTVTGHTGADYVATYTKNGMTFTTADATPSSSSVYTLTNAQGITEANVKAMGEDLASVVDGDQPDGSVVYSDSAKTINVSSLGYYYVTTTLGALISLDTTNTNVEIREKNEPPTVDKKQSTTASNYADADLEEHVGDTVYYQVVVTDKKGTDQDIVLKDTLSTGLTLDHTSTAVTDLTVVDKSGTAVDPSKYTVEDISDRGFKLTLDKSYVATLGENDTVTLTYHATINENAVINVNDSTKNSNKIELDYSAQHSEDTVYVKTYDFLVKKVIAGTMTYLPGATFKIYDASTGGNQIKVSKLSNGQYKYDKAGSADTKIELIEAGTNVKGLTPGDYWLEEIDVPAGYNRLSGREKVTVISGQTATVEIIVENQSGTELPSTGGIGTTIFYILGGLLVVGAAVILVARRKASN